MTSHTLRAPRRAGLALAAALTAALLSLSGCGKEDAKPAAATVADPTLVTPQPALLQSLKVAAAEPTQVADTLRVAGRLDFDEQRLARIGAPITGRVSEIRATLGQAVKPGEMLARINSTELGQAQLQYLKSRAASELARRSVERARTLHEAGVIASAELQRRENEYGTAQAETRAAADQLRILGMSGGGIERLAASGAIDSFSPVVSTVAGTVVERKVTQGQVVQPADALFTVADLSRLWAVADVPEQQAALVKVGQDVQLDIPALDDARLTGKLIYISDTVNPETRTVLVRTELDNKERRLKPAMLATMLIAARPEPRLTVPAAAVVREDNKDHVFVEVAAGQFRLTPVTLGPDSGGMRVVQAGLKQGQKIVVEGAFHLNNERKRAELEGA